MIRKHNILLLIILLNSCSSDNNDILPEEQPITIENAYSEQNRWIFSQMNQYYLWNEDLPDSLACNYNQNTKDFFTSLLSPKDRFSYLTTNSNYKSTEQSKWGFAYQQYKDRLGNEAYLVLYSFLHNNLVQSGDLLEFVYEKNSISHFRKLEATESGVFHELSNSDIYISLDDVNSSPSTVLKDTIYHSDETRIGYLCYLEYGDTKDLQKTITQFKKENVSEVILDLRYNPGGYISTCQYLCNCIVNECGYGKVFQQYSYNRNLSDYYKEITGSERTFSYFKAPAGDNKISIGNQIIGLNIKRLFVLTSKYTASASEATILCLKPYMEVIVIGENTVGKGVGSQNFSDVKFKYSIQPITMRYYNSIGETIPEEGLTVDYYIANGYSTQKKSIGNIDEILLHKALSIISPSKYPFKIESRSFDNIDNYILPIGEPSYVHEFNNKKKLYED